MTSPITENLVFEHKDVLLDTAADRFIDLVSTAIEQRGRASVALTGGSNGIGILASIAAKNPDIDWSKVELWWGDERFVAADDPDRNEGQARAALLDRIPLDPAKVHPMAASDGAFGDDIHAAAAAYARQVADAGPFDLHLLGMGGEGHINSLFPHTAATAETTEPVVAVEDSPKPPPRRITLTLPVVNRSRQVWFLVAGADKAEAVAAGQSGASAADWPCAGASGTERTIWFLDDAAASRLG